MFDIFKKLKGTDTPIAVYFKSSGAFSAGFVKECDDEFLCMQCISPNGRFDGWHLIRIEEILKADVSTGYLNNLRKVYNYYGEKATDISVNSKKVLESFLDTAIKKKWLCTLEIGFETIEKISGVVVARDWSTVEMQLLDENGESDGFTAFDTEDIVYVGTQSEYEIFLGTLRSIASGTEEHQKNREEKASEKVLSFPKDKK